MMHPFGPRFTASMSIFIITLIATLCLSMVVFLAEKIAGQYITDDLRIPTLVGFFIIFALLFFWLIYTLHPKINRLASVSAKLVGPEECGDIEYVITGYSPLSEPNQKTLQEYRASGWSLNEACSPKRPFLPWQQNLRTLAVIAAHGTPLKCVFVIQPDNTPFTKFKDFLQTFLPAQTEICLVNTKGDPEKAFYTPTPNSGESRSYEDADYVLKAVDRAFELISTDAGLPLQQVENRIAIDVTPGLKLFSIATAIKALDNRVKILYAKTGPEAGKVMIVDPEIVVSPSPV